MGKIRRKYTREMKLAVLREHENGKGITQLSREYEIHPNVIYRWEKELKENPENAFRGRGNTRKEEARIAELERILGQLYAENAFLKKTLAKLETKLQELRGQNGQR